MCKRLIYLFVLYFRSAWYMKSWFRQRTKGFQDELNHKNSISNFSNVSFEVFLFLLILQTPNFLAVHLKSPCRKRNYKLVYTILFLAGIKRKTQQLLKMLMNWLAKMVKIMHEYYELIGLAPFLISTSLCIQNLTVLDLFTGDFFFLFWMKIKKIMVGILAIAGKILKIGALHY